MSVLERERRGLGFDGGYPRQGHNPLGSFWWIAEAEKWDRCHQGPEVAEGYREALLEEVNRAFVRRYGLGPEQRLVEIISAIKRSLTIVLNRRTNGL